MVCTKHRNPEQFGRTKVIKRCFCTPIFPTNSPRLFRPENCAIVMVTNVTASTPFGKLDRYGADLQDFQCHVSESVLAIGRQLHYDGSWSVSLCGDSGFWRNKYKSLSVYRLFILVNGAAVISSIFFIPTFSVRIIPDYIH